jgi:CubicO group peptidase (beta-lactamase class C family)
LVDILRPPHARSWPLAGAPEEMSWTNWDWPPVNRWGFQHIADFLRTERVARGHGPVRSFGSARQDITGIGFSDFDGTRRNVGEMLERTFTDGFLVVHDGKIVAEHYLNSMTPATLHLSQSVVKSFTSTLIGILVGQGLIDIDNPVTHYLPELAKSGYAGATVRQVLDMRSGVKFGEDYLAPNSEVAQLDRASGWKPRRDAADVLHTKGLIQALELERPHGGPFLYRSIETEVLGWIAARVSGQSLAALMSNELWQKMGAEADANLTIDDEGTALADGGLSACLRDYARLGQLFLDKGAWGNKQIVPESWVAACSTGDIEAFKPNYVERFRNFPNAAYSRQWWVIDSTAGLITARGIYGQLIHIEPARRLVVAKLSSWPDPLSEDLSSTTYCAIEAIGRVLTAG